MLFGSLVRYLYFCVIKFWTAWQELLSWIAQNGFTNIRSSCYHLLLIFYQLFEISYSYSKYSTSNTIEFASDQVIEIPAPDFCFAIPAAIMSESGIPQGDNNFHVTLNKNLIEKTSKRGQASVIYYMLYGLLCHSIRVENKSSTDWYTDRGTYSEDNDMDGNDLMRLKGAKHVVSNFTFTEEMYFTMHSLKELSHHPADSFFVSRRSFTIPHQVVFFIYPDVVTQHRLPIPYDTLCMEPEGQIMQNITYSSRQCFESCYASDFMKAHEAFPNDSPQFIRVNRRLVRTMIATNSPENERIKQQCHSKCHNDCHQVHYSCRRDFFDQMTSQSMNISEVSFVFKRAQQEIVIRYSATVSFWDIMSVLFYGASFYLTFCPATWILSDLAESIFKKIYSKCCKRNQTNRDNEPDDREDIRRRGVRIAWRN